MCSQKSVGISVDLNTYEPHLLAGTMAHMIGHNIGMSHDDGSPYTYTLCLIYDLYTFNSMISKDPCNATACVFSTMFSGSDCNCRDWHGCIMAQSIVGLENVQPYKFSECSKTDYIEALRSGNGICLFNKPNEVRES